MVLSIEQHVEWIADCISYLRTRQLAPIEATVEAENAWVAHVNEVANYTLFPLANSWYMLNPSEAFRARAALLEAMSAYAAGRFPRDRLLAAGDVALRDTIARFEQTDSPVFTDGEQTKPSFATVASRMYHLLLFTQAAESRRRASVVPCSLRP